MGRLWTACEGIQDGDVVLAPKPDRTYQFGVVTSGYEYHPGSALPHRRRVDWKGSFSRDDMSPALAFSAAPSRLSPNWQPTLPSWLAMGLVDVGRMMGSIVAKASEGTEADAYAHLRTPILCLVSDGSFNPGPPNPSN